MNKRRIYFNEYNLKMGNAIYLPIVSGTLTAFAKQNSRISEHYDFMPFHFQYDHVDQIVAKHVNPDVIAFSASMWNITLCLTVSRKVKEAYPNCLVLFGGPSVPFNAEPFLQKHPWIDIAVRGEGELRFTEILLENLDEKDFSKIGSITYRSANGDIHKNHDQANPQKDLDFPSPYTSGEFDHILQNHDLVFQAIIETNRGCPYNCSFCFWGMGGLNTKYKFFGMDSIRATAEWIGKNKIPYVFCADSNFGIHRRDLEIADMFVQTKKTYGFPEKFRVCYAKNSTNTVFEICKLFHQHNLEKGATLSFQTMNEEVSKNVGRKNIKLDVYKALQKKYNEIGIPVYTELIVGLPGETTVSFLEGIEYILRAGIKNQLFCYFCQVYPNTELADPEYQRKHGIKTVSIPMTEIHCSPKESISIEHEDIIISTNTMTVEDWKQMAKISWLTQFLFSMKSAFYIMILLQRQYQIPFKDVIWMFLNIDLSQYPCFQKINAEFDRTLDAMLTGVGKCRIDLRFGNMYWDVEELIFLTIMHDSRVEFYSDLKRAVYHLLELKGVSFHSELIENVFRFNEALVYNPIKNEAECIEFSWKLPDFFENVFVDDQVKAVEGNQKIVIEESGPFELPLEYARRIVLFGRKSGSMLRKYRTME